MRLRMIPVAWLVLTLVAMRLADKYFPVMEFASEALRSTGNLLFALAGAIFIAAAWQFYRKKTTVDPFGDPTALITGGIYRVSRNPIYLAMVLVVFGGALRMSSLMPWVFVPVFVWIMQTQYIVREERLLAAEFADEFDAYCQRVRRWI